MSDPEKVGQEAFERSIAHMKTVLPAIQMAAATQACLQQLVALLIEKKVISPQDALDAFARASDDIQRCPDSGVAVQTVEGMCSFIAKIPGAKRGAA